MLFNSALLLTLSGLVSATFPAGFRNCGDSAKDALDLEGVRRLFLINQDHNEPSRPCCR